MDCLMECCQCHAEMCKGIFSGCAFVAKECDAITCNSYASDKSKGNYKPVTKAPKSIKMTRDTPIVF